MKKKEREQKACFGAICTVFSFFLARVIVVLLGLCIYFAWLLFNTLYYRYFLSF